MRPRRFHMKDGDTDVECGEMLNGRCQGCGRKTFLSGTFRTGSRKSPVPIGDKPKMTREEYVEWKAVFLGISREEAERGLEASRAGR
mgnify:FL=1